MNMIKVNRLFSILVFGALISSIWVPEVYARCHRSRRSCGRSYRGCGGFGYGYPGFYAPFANPWFAGPPPIYGPLWARPGVSFNIAL